jgi:hypothetical protein
MLEIQLSTGDGNNISEREIAVYLHGIQTARERSRTV